MKRLLTFMPDFISLLSPGIFGVRLGLYAVTPIHPQASGSGKRRPLIFERVETNGEIARQLQAKQTISEIRW